MIFSSFGRVFFIISSCSCNKPFYHFQNKTITTTNNSIKHKNRNNKSSNTNSYDHPVAAAATTVEQDYDEAHIRCLRQLLGGSFSWNEHSTSKSEATVYVFLLGASILTQVRNSDFWLNSHPGWKFRPNLRAGPDLDFPETVVRCRLSEKPQTFGDEKIQKDKPEENEEEVLEPYRKTMQLVKENKRIDLRILPPCVFISTVATPEVGFCAN